MKVTRIKIHQLLGVEDLEFEPSQGLTTLSGRNATGKSSVLEVVKAMASRGNDASLLRHGNEFGEAVFLIEDGTELSMKVYADRIVREVTKMPGIGTPSQTQTVLNRLLPMEMLNPVDFIAGTEAEQRAWFLRALPITVTAEQIKAAVGMAITTNYARHGLEVITEVDKKIRDERTKTNNSLKEKTATAKSLTESLPEDPPEGDWGTEVLRCEAKITDLLQQYNAKLAEDSEAYAAAKDQIDAMLHAEEEKLRTSAQQRIDEIKQAFEEHMTLLRGEAQAGKEAAVAVLQTAREEVQREYGPQEEEWKAKKTESQTKAEMHAKAEGMRMLLDKQQKEMARLSTETSRLTKAIAGLKHLKDELLQDLPIQGVELREGGIYVDDIPLKRVNEARKVKLSFDLALLRQGEVGLMILDGLERLDSVSSAELIKVIEDQDVQVLGARTSEDEQLTVTTEGN